ncbi:MAG TPA: YcxB family protein [Candidatus Hydrogenedentes bacterium]|nr:YcxB family protein [Candidatus Hydrogenedentota bacterium]
MEPVRLEFEVTQDDFVAFGQYFYKHTAEGKRGMRRMVILGLLLLGVFVYSEFGGSVSGIEAPLQFAARLSLLLLLLAAVYATYLQYVRPAVVGWICRSSALHEMLGHTIMTIAPDRITIENPHGRGVMNWDGVQDVAETPDHIFLVTGHLRAFIIPKRAFADHADAANCFQALHACFRSRDRT